MKNQKSRIQKLETGKKNIKMRMKEEKFISAINEY